MGAPLYLKGSSSDTINHYFHQTNQQHVEACTYMQEPRVDGGSVNATAADRGTFTQKGLGQWRRRYQFRRECFSRERTNSPSNRLRHLIDKFCENCVYISVASHFREPKACNICTNFSQPVNDDPELTPDSSGSETFLKQ